MSKFTVQFWGVRGSLASPGPSTAGVGGNTSWVEVVCGEQRLVLDAGTGLRGLGEHLIREGPAHTNLLLSHMHWDHIQGLPFFAPLYVPGQQLTLHGPGWAPGQLDAALQRQMTAPTFPVDFKEVGAKVDTRELTHGQKFNIGGVDITCAKLNHPGGSLGYRLEYAGRSVVYATDTEHYRCVDPILEQLAENADVLIYAAQYTPEEYRGDAGPAKVGWGHSTYESGIELARTAGVGQLLLFHHDPKRSDDAVAKLERAAQGSFERTLAAREGMVLSVEDGVASAA
jgi:phosphoribosyl 1,2-cyclic phosphodiesterase